jgi:hypothetical protein
MLALILTQVIRPLKGGSGNEGSTSPKNKNLGALADDPLAMTRKKATD